MFNQLMSSFVRIYSASGAVAGNGLLVDKKRVLTSASTVADALGIPPETHSADEAEVQVDFPCVGADQRIKARVVFWQPPLATDEAGSDIAVLELECCPPDEVECIPPPAPTNMHYINIARAITDGRVVPFLGAGASLFGRPEGASFQPGHHLPGGGELATHLAETYGYPLAEMRDLVRVSQYVTLVSGLGPLYSTLHEFFDVDYPVTDLHRFFASLPALLREKGHRPKYQLIVTTNYDDVLERAFRDAGEPFDLVSYVADGNQRGKFLHWPPDGDVRLIDRPNEDRIISTDKRTVILKIHGAIDRLNPDRDSYVITEDHYIDYLTHTDVSNLIPVTLAAKLKMSHFLFLGYSLRDWNLRVILHRIWGEQILNFKSWAIQINPQEMDQRFWTKRDVDILNARLEDFISQLSSRLHASPPVGGRS
ncbi:MAG TPA: SIR2 family protein [Blastocatellia bacterium]|nr:SIR2 family protein [Blastocatellia bacterium]